MVMSDPEFVAAGSAPKVVGTTLVALYHPSTGRIHHLHHVVVHEGAASIDADAAVATARRHAATLGHDPDALRVAISTDPAHGASLHRIDVASGRWIPVRTDRRASRDQAITR